MKTYPELKVKHSFDIDGKSLPYLLNLLKENNIPPEDYKNVSFARKFTQFENEEVPQMIAVYYSKE